MNQIVSPVSRRRAVQILAMLGASAPLTTRLFGQAPKRITPEALRSATVLIDQDFSQERLEKITPALQRNFDQFQIVRDLEIDDRVEPTPIFNAQWR